MTNDVTLQPGVDLWANQSERAQGVLDYVLDESDPETQTERSKLIAVEEAKRAKKILDTDTGRSQSRVLFVTTDATALGKNSATQKEYLDLTDQFDEIHVLVLKTGSKKVTVQRHDETVWFYTAAATSWWRQVTQAYLLAKQHLRFNEGVRPDIIVARDPYVSTLAAYLIGRNFKRSVQVHVTDDVYIKMGRKFGLSDILFRFALKRARSVAVGSDQLLRFLRTRVSSATELTTLPVFRNFTRFQTSAPQFRLSERYPQYTFFILTSGPLHADSHLHDAFTALHMILHNPKIALVVVADGPARVLFQEKAKVLGIETNVIFISTHDSDLVSYYRTADVLVETGITTESETRIFQAIMASLPVIAYETPLRVDLLPDGEAAYLIAPDDTLALMQKVNSFLNQTAIRKQFARRLGDIATSRLHEDPVAYRRALRDVIEAAFLAEAIEPAVSLENNLKNE